MIDLCADAVTKTQGTRRCANSTAIQVPVPVVQVSAACDRRTRFDPRPIVVLAGGIELPVDHSGILAGTLVGAIGQGARQHAVRVVDLIIAFAEREVRLFPVSIDVTTGGVKGIPFDVQIAAAAAVGAGGQRSISLGAGKEPVEVLDT
jgi:hypothetical protein